jgi:hypothetical protein
VFAIERMLKSAKLLFSIKHYNKPKEIITKEIGMDKSFGE